MELLSIIRARAIWLFPLIDSNPRGQYMMPAVPALKERYSFASAPGDIVGAAKRGDGLVLDEGVFTHNGRDLAVSMTIYQDGVVADTRSSTDDSESFLQDVLKFMHDTYNTVPADRLTINKAYASEVYVRCEKSLNFINPFFNIACAELSKAAQTPMPATFEVFGFSIGPDPVSPFKPAHFKLERAGGVPFTQNRYYSFSPTSTAAHLELLDRIERAMLSKGS